MASTYSALKIQLMATGENSGTWGNVTNDNLGIAVEEAIAESADVAFTGSNVTISLTDTNASQTARNLRLNLTGTGLGATTALTVPDIEKPYIVNNGLSDAVEVKNSTGSNVTVPAGKTMWVYSTGSNVVDVTNHASSLTLSTPLAAGSGGTGLNALGANVATFLGTPSSANLINAVTDETGTGSLVFANTPTLVTPLLGTPTSGTLTNCTADGTNAVGFKNIPAIADKTAAYTLATGDVGKVVGVGSGGSIEIPDATFAAGDAVLVFNNTSGDVTITCTITTAYIAGADADVATVTLSTRGVANILFLSGTACVLTGNIA